LKDHPIAIDPQHLSADGKTTRNLLAEMKNRFKVIGLPMVDYNLKPKSSVVIRFTRLSYVGNDGVHASLHVILGDRIKIRYNSVYFRKADRLMSEIVELLCEELINEASARAVMV
jgi:hypothetical protein